MSSRKRLLSVLILLSMGMTAMVSCSEGQQDGETETVMTDTEAYVNSSVDETEEAVKTGRLDELPENLKFEGDTVTFYSREHFRFNDELTVDELNGDMVNDAIFNREQAVEDRLDVNIENVKQGGNHGSFDNMRALVQAGDSSYDIFTSSMYTASPGAASGIFYDWNDIEYVDLEKPYYTQDYIEKSGIGNRNYTVTGDISLSLIRYSFCMYFNKQLVDDYKIESPYEMVLSGKWTHDKLQSIVSDIYMDLNTNGTKDDEDIYGLGTSNVIIVDAYTSSYDMRMFDCDFSGIPFMDVDTEKFINVIEKLYKLNWETTGSYAYVEISDNNEMTDLCNYFSQDHLVFMNNWIYGSETEYLRTMETDFGIIPYPKYDEAQEQYYTFQHDQIGVFAIPITSQKPNIAGAVFEAMSSESRYSLVPTYYDIALKSKYSRDKESAEMIDIIHNNHKLDIGWIFCSYIGDLAQTPRNLLLKKSADFSSYYASHKKIYEKKLGTLIRDFDKID